MYMAQLLFGSVRIPAQGRAAYRNNSRDENIRQESSAIPV